MRKIMGLLALLLLPSYAFGQPAVSANPPIGIAGAYNSGTQTCTSGQPCWVQTDVNGKMLVSASVSASVGGFAPSLSYTTCTATGSTCSSTALPTNTGTVVLFNSGTDTVSCNLAVGAATGTASKIQIPASSGIGLATTYSASTYDHFACIDQTASTSNVVIASGGTGLAAGWGGGGSGGGGGGAVTVADGADVTQGAKADAACSTDNGTCTVDALIKRTNQNLTTLNTSVTSSIPAGTNQIGTVSADPCAQTTKTTQAFTTSSAGPVSIVALSGSTKVYVCSISAITDTAIKLNFIDGTGGSCASAQHAIWGSTTAANGMSLAANGGFTMGNGGGTVGVTAAASAFCLLQSGTSLVAGNVTYVQQ